MEYLVIDVGGTYTKYAVMTEQGELLEKGKFPTITDPLESFLKTITDLYGVYKDRVCGIALSMPGIIDSDSGFMYTGGMIDCIRDFNITEELYRRCQVPVTVENDARSAALAEVWKGALKDCKNGIVIVCGTGIGGAVVLDHKVIRGAHHMAGEFSYQLTENKIPYEEKGMFGFESGIGALMRAVSERTHIPETELNGEKVFNMAEKGNTEVIEAIRGHARKIAVQISNYRFILDPERIAVGGGISARPLFIRVLKEELETVNKAYARWGIKAPEVTACKFFNDSNLMGALYVHLCKQKERG